MISAMSFLLLASPFNQLRCIFEKTRLKKRISTKPGDERRFRRHRLALLPTPPSSRLQSEAPCGGPRRRATSHVPILWHNSSVWISFPHSVARAPLDPVGLCAFSGCRLGGSGSLSYCWVAAAVTSVAATVDGYWDPPVVGSSRSVANLG